MPNHNRQWGRVTLVGTVHLSPKSLNRVHTCIRERQADVVAVELNPFQYDTSRNRRQWSMMRVHREGATVPAVILYLIPKRRQKPLRQKKVDFADADMLPAIEEAADKQIRVALIDRPIVTTLNRLVEELLSFSAITGLLRNLLWHKSRNEFLDRVGAFIHTLPSWGSIRTANSLKLWPFTEHR